MVWKKYPDRGIFEQCAGIILWKYSYPSWFFDIMETYAKDDDQFLPPFVKQEKLEKDWIVVKSLMPILRDLQQLGSNLDDTIMVAGSEAYVGALSYYNSVKYGARVNIADAKIIYEDLRKRFERPSSSSPTNGMTSN